MTPVIWLAANRKTPLYSQSSDTSLTTITVTLLACNHNLSFFHLAAAFYPTTTCPMNDLGYQLYPASFDEILLKFTMKIPPPETLGFRKPILEFAQSNSGELCITPSIRTFGHVTSARRRGSSHSSLPGPNASFCSPIAHLSELALIVWVISHHLPVQNVG